MTTYFSSQNSWSCGMGVGREGVLSWVTKRAMYPKAMGQMRVVSPPWYSVPCTRPRGDTKIPFYAEW